MSAPLPVLPLLPELVVGTGFHIPKGRLTTILPVAAAAFGAYLLCKYSGGKEDGRVNKTIDKDTPKVVHTIDMDELGDKVSYCRCWRSRKFPLCDGSHGQHNKETGDNVGPLVIRRRKQ